MYSIFFKAVHDSCNIEKRQIKKHRPASVYYEYAIKQLSDISMHKQPSCEKVCGSEMPARVKKDEKLKVAAKKWLRNSSMAKFLVMTNSGEFVCPPPSVTNSPELSLLKFLPLNYAISWLPPL